MRAFFALLVPLASWVLRRVRRDYEERGRLSVPTAAGAWALYALHAGLIGRAARRSA